MALGQWGEYLSVALSHKSDNLLQQPQKNNNTFLSFLNDLGL